MSQLHIPSLTPDDLARLRYRNGKQARVGIVDGTVVSIHPDDGIPYAYAESGLFEKRAESEWDLILPPDEPKRHVRWVNFYDGDTVGYSNRASADSFASDTRIARVRVEFVEGQFDE